MAIRVQESYNKFVDINKAFGVIPAAFELLVDLGVSYKYQRVLVLNGTDSDIILKFGSSEMLIKTNISISLDAFLVQKEISYKYVSGAPTSGDFKLVIW